ncbi:MAG: MFS transporter [Acetilactobacillus jinshanensis]
MISTIQQLSALITLFLSIWIARKIGMKKTIGIGIFMTAIFGIMPAFSQNFTFILIARFAWGIGLGLLNSLAIDAINIYFRHRESLRIKMSGYRTAMEPFGQCILDIMMGLLVMINWQVSFLAYGLIFLIFIYFWKCFPKTNNQAIKCSHKTPSVTVFYRPAKSFV